MSLGGGGNLRSKNVNWDLNEVQLKLVYIKLQLLVWYSSKTSSQLVTKVFGSLMVGSH